MCHFNYLHTNASNVVTVKTCARYPQSAQVSQNEEAVFGSGDCDVQSVTVP